jgi:hypothetical protein
MVVINCSMLGSQQQMAESCCWATVDPTASGQALVFVCVCVAPPNHLGPARIALQQPFAASQPRFRGTALPRLLAG